MSFTGVPLLGDTPKTFDRLLQLSGAKANVVFEPVGDYIDMVKAGGVHSAPPKHGDDTLAQLGHGGVISALPKYGAVGLATDRGLDHVVHSLVASGARFEEIDDSGTDLIIFDPTLASSPDLVAFLHALFNVGGDHLKPDGILAMGKKVCMPLSKTERTASLKAAPRIRQAYEKAVDICTPVVFEPIPYKDPRESTSMCQMLGGRKAHNHRMVHAIREQARLLRAPKLVITDRVPPTFAVFVEAPATGNIAMLIYGRVLMIKDTSGAEKRPNGTVLCHPVVDIIDKVRGSDHPDTTVVFGLATDRYKDLHV